MPKCFHPTVLISFGDALTILHTVKFTDCESESSSVIDGHSVQRCFDCKTYSQIEPDNLDEVTKLV